MRFFDFLFPLRADEHIVRDASPDTFLALLDPELVALGGENATALLPFPDPLVRAAIHEAKYHGNEKAFELLAAVLAEYLHNLVSENYGFTKSLILVPVPLGAARRKERGFNQAEEVLVRAVKILKKEWGDKNHSGALALGIEPNLLTRTRDTVSQVSLPRHERLANMRGAFFTSPELLRRRANSNCTYIVFDDVLTTGATLAAACSALQSAGAQDILAVALAH